MKKAACHIHTHYSYDSMSSPKALVEAAIKHKVDYLLICDHDSWEGSVKAREYATQKGYSLTIPFAVEVFTDIGDVIVVNSLEPFPLVKDHRELYRKVKELDGYTILPHPYDGHDLNNVDYECIDVIEVFNSRSQQSNNDKAMDLAKTLGKPFIFGSDAHFLRHFTNAFFMFEGTPPHFESVSAEQLLPTKRRDKKMSQVIKGIKTWDLMLILRSLKRIITQK